MVFSDANFLFLFLPLALVGGLLLRRVAFAPFILAASLIFYFWSAGYGTWILLFTIALNYIGGRLIEARPTRLVLVLFVAGNLALLGYFKYVGFLAVTVDGLAGSGIASFVGEVGLPIGISFFTFQGISYLVDVYRRAVAAEPNIVLYSAYKAFFPQLIAGPIVRYRDVVDDFRHPKAGVDIFAAGATRFVHGLFKKVVIADSVAPIADAVFALPAGEAGFAGAWLGAFAFALQIYFDFSGYSDMAIGLGQMFGIRFHENFARPYSSRSVTEFWRRWHISLSTWFRDYLYIPLGGNRHGAVATYRNLVIVFFLTGLWHGAAWTYVVWGLFQGAFLIAERSVLGRRVDALPTVLRYVYFLPALLVGWVIFRAADLGQAGALITAMASPFSAGAFVLADPVVAALTPVAWLAGVAGSIIFLLPGEASFGQRLSHPGLSTAGRLAGLAYLAGASALAGLFVLSGSFSPFLYFQF